NGTALRKAFRVGKWKPIVLYKLTKELLNYLFFFLINFSRFEVEQEVIDCSIFADINAIEATDLFFPFKIVGVKKITQSLQHRNVCVLKFLLLPCKNCQYRIAMQCTLV